MTPAQFAEAQRLAREWKPKPFPSVGMRGERAGVNPVIVIQSDEAFSLHHCCPVN